MNEPVTYETPIYWVTVRAQCPKCGGEMMFRKSNVGNGYVTMDGYSETPSIPHKCNKCGHEEFYGRAYPHVDGLPVYQRQD